MATQACGIHSTLTNANCEGESVGPDFWRLKHLLTPTALMPKVKDRGLFQSFLTAVLQTF